MTITVGIDTYLTIAQADAYWARRNNSVWSAATDAQKEKALLESTQYLDNAYSFIGHHVDDNPLAWPRHGAKVKRGNFKGEYYSSEIIPPQIKNACAELALEALDANLRPTLDRGGAIKREKVDVIEIEYMDFAPSQRSFTFVSILLKPLLESGGSMRKLVRT